MVTSRVQRLNPYLGARPSSKILSNQSSSKVPLDSLEQSGEQINTYRLFYRWVGGIQNSAYRRKEKICKNPPKAGFCFTHIFQHKTVKILIDTAKQRLYNVRMKNFLSLESWRKLLAFNTSSFAVLVLMLFLLPIFFVPSPFVSFQFGKMILLATLSILAFVLFLVSLLKSGSLPIPRSSIFLALALILIVHLLSSLFGNAPSASLIGYGFEVTSFTTILILSFVTFLVSALCQSPKRLLVVFKTFFIVSLVLALFHVLRLFFGAGFLSFGYFPNIISNTVGKWNELSIFFSITTILSLAALDILRSSLKARVVLSIFLILSLVMLVVINLPIVWYVIGAISLIFFVYLLSFGGVQTNTMDVVSSSSGETRLKSSGRRISFGSLAVLIIAIIFAFTPLGSTINASIATKAKISSVEVRPSWSATLDISKEVFKETPLLGPGPNRFGTVWQLHRPDVNLTNFWNTNFSHGIGFIPTTLIETGILGAIAWFIFFAFFLILGFRSTLSRFADRQSRFFVVSSFMVSLFLWIMNILYMPNTPILFLTFFFTGLFVASLYVVGFSRPLTISFSKYPRMSFVFVMTFVFIIVVSLGLGYIILGKSLSSFYYERGAAIARTSRANVDVALGSMLKALNLSSNDVYLRSVAELNVVRLGNIISTVDSGADISEDLRNEFQNVLAAAIEASRRAQMKDPENYENWLSIARVYESIIPIGVAAAYDNAKVAYGEAIKRSPRNPALYLYLARLEATQNNLSVSKQNIARAIELKPNYLDAIFFLSQIDAAEGNIRGAIVSVEKILTVSPNDPNLLFRLGLLKYGIKDYVGAVKAFEQATSAIPVYANAKYFLGLSYEKLGRLEDAKRQFEDLARTNPENAEIKLILDNLKAGKDPFASATAPVDSKPEKRKNLPVEEKKS